jgi:hypothetical protein
MAIAESTVTPAQSGFAAYVVDQTDILCKEIHQAQSICSIAALAVHHSEDHPSEDHRTAICLSLDGAYAQLNRVVEEMEALTQMVVRALEPKT